MAQDRFGHGTPNITIGNEAFEKIKEATDEEGNLDIGILFKSGMINEWLEKPWDKKNDLNFINSLLKPMHKSFKKESDKWWIPAANANERATDNILKFIKLAQQKEGAPNFTKIRNQKLYAE